MSSSEGNMTDPNFRWGRYCFNNPSSPLCADVDSFYEYRIWLAPNALFIALFGLSLVGYLGVYAATRRGLAFTLAMASGVVLEILGYAGRIMSYNNQWDENGFLMQICCLTIAPAFMAAGIYLCLRRIVYAFGPENSRLKPEWYTRLVSSVQPRPSIPTSYRPSPNKKPLTRSALAHSRPYSSSPATSSPSSCRRRAAAWRR